MSAGLGPSRVIDVRAARPMSDVSDIDVIIDTVGGEALTGWFAGVKQGGVVGVVDSATESGRSGAPWGARRVLSRCGRLEGLEKISKLIDNGELTTQVGEVLPLESARIAHEMLAGRPHNRGKIVLAMKPRAGDLPAEGGRHKLWPQ